MSILGNIGFRRDVKMKNEDGKIVFSEEDKKHIVVKQYLASELEEKEKQYRKKRNIRRIIFILYVKSQDFFFGI